MSTMGGDRWFEDAPKRKPKPKPKKPSPQAQAWAAPRTIFVPPAFTKPTPKPKAKPTPRYDPGATKRAPKQTRRDELHSMVQASLDRREFSLGVKGAPTPAPNIADAVPVHHNPAQQHTLDLLAHPPSAVTVNARNLLDWKKSVIHSSSLSPAEKLHMIGDLQDAYTTTGWHGPSVRAVGQGLQDMVNPIAHLVIPNPGGLDPRHAPAEYTPADLKKKYEDASDVAFGKGLTNLAFNRDAPNTWGQAAGIGIGLAGVLPFGRITPAVKAIREATAAADAERLYTKAARAAAKNSTAEEIATGRATIQEEIDANVAAVEQIHADAGGEPLTNLQAKAIKAHVEQIQDLHVRGEILRRAEGGTATAFQGWAPKQTIARVQSKLNPKNIAKGVAYKNPTILNKAGIHVAGPITPEQWVQKILAAFPTAAERDHWGSWYQHFAPAFREAFGPLADDLMRGFAVSQANNSPTGGMLAALRVLDRLQRGDTPETISHLGIGTKSLVSTIAKAVHSTDGKIDQGVAAKLSDFIDSFLEKDTRTWMGDHPLGGKPSAVDVHALRDVGLVDKKLVGKLEKVHGLKLGKDFVIDSQGAASGPLYERVSEMYTRFADHLNEIQFDGRTNWRPSEAQALGWGATQKTHGVNPEDLRSAFEGNTRQFNMGLGDVGEGFSVAQSQAVLEAVRPHIQRIIDSMPNVFPEGEVSHGLTDGKPSLHFKVQSSPEAAQSIVDKLATTFDQHEIQAVKNGGSGAKPTLRIAVPDEEAAAKIFASLSAAAPKRFKNYRWAEGQMHLTMPGKQITVEANAAFHKELETLLSDAADAAGIDDLQYHGVNQQVIKGKNHGESDVSGTDRAGAERALGDHYDAQARKAFDAATKRVQGRAFRARSGLAEERGQLELSRAPTRTRTLGSNDLTVQMPGSRSRVTRRLIEDPSDAMSRLLVREGRVPAIARFFMPTASADMRVSKQAGRLAARRAERERSAMKKYGVMLPKKEGSAEDVAHFWWSQLPVDMRNVEGLQAVHAKQAEELQYLTSGEAANDMMADLEEIDQALKEWDGEGPPYDLIQQRSELKYDLADIEPKIEDLSQAMARLEGVIKNPPAYDAKIVDAVHAFAKTRQRTLVEAGVLDPDRAYYREGLLSRWLGAEPTGEEAFIGHRLGTKVRGSRPSGMPAQVGTGKPGVPEGVSARSTNRLVLAKSGRLRDSTHVAVEDWEASQVYVSAIASRDDLGRLGTPWEGRLPHGYLLVNPKGRVVPKAWKQDRLKQIADQGYDDEQIRVAAKEIVDSYTADAAHLDSMLADAKEQGIDLSELRVVKESTAKRYFGQFQQAPRGGKAISAYDTLVDIAVASIVFARIGYIPKNALANLILAVPHQGAYFFANAPRAVQVWRDPELRHLVAGEVGHGATFGLTSESKNFNPTGKVAGAVTSLADLPVRMTAFLHEAAAEGIIPRLSNNLSDADRAALKDLFENPRKERLLNDISARANEAMVDFSRLTPVQRKMARRFVIIPSWLWSGSRYPFHFAATHPGRAAAIGYVAAGEPGAPDRFKTPPAWNVLEGKTFLQGVPTPWGRFRTNSISPVSTPIDMAASAVNTVRGVNPYGTDDTLWDSAGSLVGLGQQILSGDVRGKKGWIRVGKSMVPSGAFIAGEIRPKASGYYPEDATRWGRLKRELGVLPIQINDEPATKSGPADTWVADLKAGKLTAYGVENKMLDRGRRSLVAKGKKEEAVIYHAIAVDVHATQGIPGYQPRGVAGINSWVDEWNQARQSAGLKPIEHVTQDQYDEVADAARAAKEAVAKAGG